MARRGKEAVERSVMKRVRESRWWQFDGEVFRNTQSFSILGIQVDVEFESRIEAVKVKVSIPYAYRFPMEVNGVEKEFEGRESFENALAWLANYISEFNIALTDKGEEVNECIQWRGVASVAGILQGIVNSLGELDKVS